MRLRIFFETAMCGAWAALYSALCRLVSQANGYQSWRWSPRAQQTIIIEERCREIPTFEQIAVLFECISQEERLVYKC